MATSVARFDVASLRHEFVEQGEFIAVPDMLSPENVARLIDAVAAVKPALNRNYLPGHKQGGSASRHTLDRLTPFVAELYRSTALIDWLGAIAGIPLLCSPPDDPHAYAFYFYTRPGDHIGWHYDTSYYRGRRYTVLFGVIEASSCCLEYELHTRTDRAVVRGSLQMTPGGLVFFNGDALRHRITPLAMSEERVSLTFEYVTDLKMRPWCRLISNAKDAVAYFGIRQTFGRKTKNT